ncbi:TPA: peptidase, partial [Neisseria gonorrhoeae]
ARGAAALGRTDIAGKTGTTNDNKDAWFVGFNPDVVTAVYIGFDKPKSMGRAGYGGTIAVPVWVDYMRFALKGKQGKGMKMPEGVVSSNGEYYMKERMVTDPGLMLDNSGIAPQPSRRAKEDDEAAVENEQQGRSDETRQDVQETPVLPSNTDSKQQQLDSLF